ncbi:MAG TPA: hypothetical protein VJV79_07465 [Polyangiaceae bacterium]|nr:hypothetical protein [Polyangiaceae bacterium]
MIEQGVLGGTPGRAQDEIRSVRATGGGGSINQASLIGANADIQRLARRRFWLDC